MLFEYQLPLTSKRADVVLAGRHPRTGGPSYLVVELKQWSSAERFEDSDTLIRIEQYGERPVTHPALQVRGLLRLPARASPTVLAEEPRRPRRRGVPAQRHRRRRGRPLPHPRATSTAGSSPGSAAVSSRTS